MVPTSACLQFQFCPHRMSLPQSRLTYIIQSLDIPHFRVKVRESQIWQWQRTDKLPKENIWIIEASYNFQRQVKLQMSLKATWQRYNPNQNPLLCLEGWYFYLADAWMKDTDSINAHALVLTGHNLEKMHGEKESPYFQSGSSHCNELHKVRAVNNYGTSPLHSPADLIIPAFTSPEICWSKHPARCCRERERERERERGPCSGAGIYFSSL